MASLDVYPHELSMQETDRFHFLDESTTPKALIHAHLLDQISEQGYYKGAAPQAVGSSNKEKPRQRLDVSLSIQDIVDIDCLGDKFC